MRINASDTRGQTWQAMHLVAGYFRDVMITILILGPVFAAGELLSQPWFLSPGPSWLNWLFSIVPSDSSETLFVTVAQIGATILGLYFATLGVVASTRYMNTPNRLRMLFLHNRSFNIYTSLLTSLVVVSLALEIITNTGYNLHFTALATIVLLSLVTVRGLTAECMRVFDYFDPIQLADPAFEQLSQWSNWSSRVALSKGDTSKIEEDIGELSSESISAIKELSKFLLQQEHYDVQSTAQLARKIGDMTVSLGLAKSTRPTKCKWYKHELRHPNWFTASTAERTVALATATSIQPSEAANLTADEDALEVSKLQLIASLIRPGGVEYALGAMKRTNNLLAVLGTKLALDEARSMMIRSFDALWPAIVAAPDLTDLERSALVDTIVSMPIYVELGIQNSLQSVISPNSFNKFASEIKKDKAIYSLGLPSNVLEEVEELAQLIHFEIVVEGHTRTPDWYIKQQFARILLRHFTKHYSHLKDVLQKFDGSVNVELATIASMRHVQFAAQTRIIEMTRKLHPSLRSVALATTELTSYNKTNFPTWPDLEPFDQIATYVEELDKRVINGISNCLAEFATEPHYPDGPDWFGHAYSVVAYRIFAQALSTGDTNLFAALFNKLLGVTADAFRTVYELTKDLDVTSQSRFLVDPVLEILELSGYAKLYSELDGSEFWTICQASWEQYLAAHPLAAEFIALCNVAVTDHDSLFGGTSRSIERSGRYIEFTQLLKERGIVNDRSHRLPSERRNPPAHHSPIIRAFAPGSLGPHYLVAALTIVEYLRTRPEWSGQLSRSCVDLQDAIDRQAGREGSGD